MSAFDPLRTLGLGLLPTHCGHPLSSDGGVEAIAFDLDPITRRQFVIQASSRAPAPKRALNARRPA